MIIYLNRELIDICRLDSDSPLFTEVFENLAQIRARGYHYVIPDRDLLQRLKFHEKLSETSKRIYQSIENKYSTHAPILNSVDFLIHVSSFSSIRYNNNQIECPINELDEEKFFGRNKLLLENSNDGFIYNEIVNYYKSENNFTARINWDICNGGGSTTFNEFIRITEEQERYVYCILDSDKISPSDTIGSTAKAFTDSSHSTVYGDYKVLPVHEMENLFPFEIYNSYVHHKSLYRTNCSRFDKIAKKSNSEIAKFIDLKKGITKFQLREMDNQSKVFWESNLQEHNISFSNCSCTSNACNHYIFRPIGNNITDKIIAFYESLNCKMHTLLNSIYINIWIELGKVLFERYCCPDRLRLI